MSTPNFGKLPDGNSIRLGRERRQERARGSSRAERDPTKGAGSAHKSCIHQHPTPLSPLRMDGRHCLQGLLGCHCSQPWGKLHRRNYTPLPQPASEYARRVHATAELETWIRFSQAMTPEPSVELGAHRRDRGSRPSFAPMSSRY